MKTFLQLFQESDRIQIGFSENINENANIKDIDAKWIEKSLIMSNNLKGKTKIEDIFINDLKDDGTISGYAIIKSTSKAKGDQYQRVEFGGTNNERLHFGRASSKSDLATAKGSLKGKALSHESLRRSAKRQFESIEDLHESSKLVTKSTQLRKQIETFLHDVSSEQKTVKTPNEKRVYTDIGVLVSHMLAKLQEIDNKIHMDL